MKRISLIQKSFIIEVLILLVYILLVNLYFEKDDIIIKADGVGYYEYLPSIFIHHDLVRKDMQLLNETGLYSRINDLGVYVEYEEFKVNKYPCGTAILQFPFFLYAYLNTELEGSTIDGYQKPFHTAIFYATIFYLFLSLIFLKGTLRLFEIKKKIITLSQFLLVLATPVTNYANYDAGFSHIYSLFAITAFIYFLKSYFINRNYKQFILACLFLGLIITIRHINALIILFIPFIAGSGKILKDGLSFLLKHPVKILLGILAIVGVCFIQCLSWYFQVGQFLINSYQGEGFNFMNPHFFTILFGYRKGLFVYTPILFIALLSIIWLAYKRKYYLILTWISFFTILTYVLSSWWSWYYGYSYGLRAYLEYSIVFFIPFALMLNGLQMGLKRIVIFISLFALPLNIIQTYQYKNYILHWSLMDKDKYWKVFLRTGERYKGLFWKKYHDENDYHTIENVLISDYIFIPDSSKQIYEIHSCEIHDFQSVSLIQLFIDNDYHRKNDAKLILRIDEMPDNRNHFWQEKYLIHLMEIDFNTWQTGLYDFEILPIINIKDMIIKLEIITGMTSTELKNVRIRFLEPV